MLEQSYWGNPGEAYVWFFGILIVGFVFKKIISTIIGRLIYWMFKKSTKDVEPGRFVTMILFPLEVLVVLLALFFATHNLDHPLQEVIFTLKEKDYTVKMVFDRVFQTIMVFTFTWLLVKIVEVVSLVFELRALRTKGTTDDQIVFFVRELSKFFVITFGILLLVGVVFGINVAGLLAGLGIGGIAIALAAKESIENLLASFTIFFDKPFVLGDLVTVDGYTGVIEKVGFRSTRLRTLEKSYITLPNKKMIDQALDNLTLRTSRRVSFHLGLTYDTTPNQIKAIVADIKKVIDSEELTLGDRNVNFENFGDSALNILIIYFINTTEWDEYLDIREKVNYEIMEIVEKHGSSIAFPTRTLHLINESTTQD